MKLMEDKRHKMKCLLDITFYTLSPLIHGFNGGYTSIFSLSFLSSAFFFYQVFFSSSDASTLKKHGHHIDVVQNMLCFT